MNDSGAVWKSSGQNPGRRVNDSVCCLEKKTQSLRREATCCIVVLSATLLFFPPGPGVVWRRACRLVVIVSNYIFICVPCKQQGTYFLFSVLLSVRENINMSTPRQLLAERIRKAAAKKRDAAAALVAVRDAGQGPLFNDDQVKILEVIGKQRGLGPAEFIDGCMKEIRPKLPPKATGEELLEFIL